MQRSSGMNIANKLTSSSTIINIQNIEQVIIMRNKINYLTADNKNSTLQTIDIPVDETIKWNDIKNTQLTVQNRRQSRNNGTSHSRKEFTPSQTGTRHTSHS